MSTYRMEDGTIVKTENARETYEEATRWDGNNHISIATGSQWNHQRLYCSRKGRYWLEHYSQYEGSMPHAEWVSEHEAVRWIMANEQDLPDDLAHLADDIEE